MGAVQTSETLVNSYQSTRRYNPEDSHLQPKTSHVNPTLVSAKQSQEVRPRDGEQLLLAVCGAVSLTTARSYF
jgi:hypothetical protein